MVRSGVMIINADYGQMRIEIVTVVVKGKIVIT